MWRSKNCHDYHCQQRTKILKKIGPIAKSANANEINQNDSEKIYCISNN